MSRGVDSPQSLHDYGAALVEAGVEWVGRYLGADTPNFPTKVLRWEEAQHLSSPQIGLNLVTVFETGGNNAGYFSAERGKRDLGIAVAQAQAIQQPTSSPIYFAVDFDPDGQDIHQRVLPYFQAIKSASTYEVGAYGSGAVLKALLDAGLIEYAWLAYPPGWSGHNLLSDPNIRQTTNDSELLGLDVDWNMSNGNGGGWKVPS